MTENYFTPTSVNCVYCYGIAVRLPSRPEDLQCSSTASTISCSWSQPATDVVTNYLLSWDYTGPCDTDSQSFLLSGLDRNYTLRDLEEGGTFKIILYAINSVGPGPNAEFQVTTEGTGKYAHSFCG